MSKAQPTKGKVFVLSGPSGSGKTTLHERLLLKKSIHAKLVKVVSVTTRPARPKERHGREYLFFSKPEFLRKRAAGYFLEWKKVFNHYYGTPKKTVEDILAKGQSVLLCIDVKGARDIFRKKKQAIGIFIKTPTLDVLKKRLAQRGTENSQAFSKRFSLARKELCEAKRYCYVIVNDKITKAVKELERVILNEISQ